MGGVGEKIMVSAVTGVMNLLLGKLTTLVKGKYAKFKEARKQLELLMKELILIGVALQKYAEMENPDRQMKVWMKDVRELAYDIEDCVDLFMYRVDHEPAVDNATGIWRSISKKIDDLKKVIYRFKFGEQIPELRTRANEIYELHLKYKIIGESKSHVIDVGIDPRLPKLYVEAEKLVGIERPSKDIIRRFILEDGRSSNQQCRVISIVGSGGLGKTTLANQIYKSVNSQFDCTALVTVSRKPNMMSLLKELISEIGDNGKRSGNQHIKITGNERQLIDSLRLYLQDKRYIVVVDDLWRASDWEVIQCALPRNNCKSRIIITTRIKDVAMICCSSNKDHVYEMKPLGEDDSKVLFLKRTLGAGDHLPSQLEAIMNQILHKCDGLPLAIISIGSLLANKPRTKDEWEKVRNSIGSVHGKDQQLEAMKNILSIGYCDQPHYIKTCLLYLSIYPEDSEIDRDCLIWTWIAEGFIPQKEGYSLKQVGESYFNELINRSMVQPVGIEYDGTVRACRVHDVMLDFLISQSTEENFVTISHGDDLSSHHEKIRRLSLPNKHEPSRGDSAPISWGTISLPHLRSFHLFGSFKLMPPIRDLQVLRVFSVDSSDNLSDIHFEKIANSCQLRYLGLMNTIEKSSLYVSRNFEKVSIQIEKLEFLQTLDLRGTKVAELPKAIAQLKQLMCLVADLIKLPDGFGNMEALQELSLLDISGCSLNFGKDLEKLTNLRVLKVSWLPPLGTDVEEKYMKAFVSSLCELGNHNLRSLVIKGFSFGIDLLGNSWNPPPLLLQRFVMEGNCHYFSMFPSFIESSLCDLTYLDIRVNKVEQKDFHILEDLPGLLVLRLSTPEGGMELDRVLSKIGRPLKGKKLDRIPRISNRGFQCLREFWFRNMNGYGVIFEEGAMAKLQVLDLSFHVCDDLITYDREGGHDLFDFGLRNLISLRFIKVSVFASLSLYLHAAETSIMKDAKLLPNHPEAEVVGTFL